MNLQFLKSVSPIIYQKDIFTSFAHYYSQANNINREAMFPFRGFCFSLHIYVICNHFDGVFATFQAKSANIARSLSPPTSLMGTASESSFKSSCVSFTAKDPMLLSRFLTLVVPVNHPINAFNIMFKFKFMKNEFSIKQSLTRKCGSSKVVDVVGTEFSKHTI